MKKVGKYVVISLLLLLGLCCVGVLYLFFIPNASLFNITYINNNIKVESDVKYAANKATEIELNSRSYDVNVVSTNDSKIYVEVSSNSFGFVLTKNENVEITSSIKNNTLTFNVKEPYGFAVKNNSYINLYIPKNTNYDLTITNKNATTIINDSSILINSLSYSTTSGTLNVVKGTVGGSMDLNINKGAVTLGKSVTTNSNDVTLNLSTGTFSAEHHILGDIAIENNHRGVILIKECGTLTKNVANAGGRIEIEKLSHINIKTSDTNIKIGEVSNGAIIDLTASGSVEIEKLYAYSTIFTHSGNITIEQAESTLTLRSISGNINVNNAQKTVSVYIEYGNASIHFAETATSYNESDEIQSRVLFAEIKNGSLLATGVEHIGLAEVENGIIITGNGSATVKMNNVCGENSVQGKNGSVNIVINKDSQYVLSTASDAGSVRVNLTQTSEYGGYTTKTTRITNVNCSTSNNKLTVTSNQGNLRVVDTNFG